MLTSYADETGHADDPSRIHLGMGGLLACSEKWEAFDKEWKLICYQEEVQEPFHMKEFASRERHSQFADAKWNDEKKRQRLMQRLLGAIKIADVVPIGAIVNVPDFNSLSEDQQAKLGGENREPYYVAFQMCTLQLAFAGALLVYPPQPMAMVYARLKKFTGQAEQWWYAIKEHNIFGPLMSSYAPGEPCHHTPLQAADIWAYELGRHFHYILPNQKEPRYPFKVMVEIGLEKSLGQTFFTYFDRKRLLEAIGEF